MSNEINKSGRLDKKELEIKNQIVHNLIEITELFPQYSIARHLAFIMRRKDSAAKEAFFWNNSELLDRIQKHRDELEGDQLMNVDDGVNDGEEIGLF